MAREDEAFLDGSKGMSEAEALTEAERCLNCKNASCRSGCPMGVDVPRFIAAIKEKDYSLALMVIKENHPLPAVCGYACPSSEFCEGKCVLGKKGRPVAIADLKRFVADWDFTNNVASQRWFRPRDIVIVGAGPTGITAAYECLKMGHRVTILEASSSIGGLLRNILPDFRLPRELVDMEMQLIKRFGVRIETGAKLGENVQIQDLQRIYDAVLLTGCPYRGLNLNIPGEELEGVDSGLRLLRKVKKVPLPKVKQSLFNKVVAVIGGGDVSLDVARMALRLGAAESMLIYRKGEENLPANIKQVAAAKSEGVKFIYNHVLSRLTGKDGKVTHLIADTPEGEKKIAADLVYKAIGYVPDAESLGIPGLKLTPKGLIEVDPLTQETSVAGVFAAGDLVSGPSTITEAMANGKKAVWSINKYLSNT